MKFHVVDRMNLCFFMATLAALMLVSNGNETVAPSISPSPNRGSSSRTSPTAPSSKSKSSTKGSKSKSKSAIKQQVACKGKSKGFLIYNSTIQGQDKWGNGVMLTQKNVTMMAAAASAGFTLSSKQTVILLATIAATSLISITHWF